MKFLKKLFSRKTADTVETVAMMAGRPDIAAAVDGVEKAVDAVKPVVKRKRK